MNSNNSSAGRNVLILGNPNVGKTTLFNALTGANEKIANYIGITTEITSKDFFDNRGQQHTLYDLPGTYGLSAYSPEEKEICQKLYHADPQTRVLCVLDAEHLERSLFLGTQLLELEIPICFVVTLANIAHKHGHIIDVDYLQEKLGAPVVLLEASPQKWRRQLRDIITQDAFRKPNNAFSILPENIASYLQNLAQKTHFQPSWCEFLLLQDALQRREITQGHEKDFLATIKQLDAEIPHWKTQCIRSRYTFIEQILPEAIHHISPKKSIDWDVFILHKKLGPILTIVTLFSLLVCVFILSEYPIQCCEYFIQQLQIFIQSHFPENWFRSLVCEGIIGGVGNVLLFLPQFILIVAFMGILENTGYLARTTFLLDRWMKKIGLSGPSFVALISCYACTIPGIMQTRCLHNREERLTTLFVAPWVNCSSRIPIYLLLITLLFPHASPWVKTSLLITIYATGLLAALMLAAIIRKFFLKTRNSVYISEMPPFLKPQFSYVLHLVKTQTIIFLKKAGTYILCFSIGLWICLHIKIPTGQNETTDCVRWVGHKIEPFLKPIGFDWRIGVSLLSSFGTRENFISTLGVLHNVDTQSDSACTLRHCLTEATYIDGSPAYSFATCVSLILFFMFSLQCIGTFVFVKHETYSWRLTISQFIFMNTFAYTLCLIVYNFLK